MLEIKNLQVSIEDKKILNNLNLKINSGEVHCIMGPNGAGKSTLSKILTKHPDYKVNSGSITYNVNFEKQNLLDMDINQISLNGIFVAMQHPVEITGISNFKFLQEIIQTHCKHQGISLPDKDNLKKMILNLAQNLKLPEDFLERNINEGFSGGEKKRNEVLQMLLLKPQFIFLDEIDSGLDIDGLSMIADAVIKFKNQDTSLLLVTHYHKILEKIKPNFVHILSNGEIIKSGDYSLAKKIEDKGYSWLT